MCNKPKCTYKRTRKKLTNLLVQLCLSDGSFHSSLYFAANFKFSTVCIYHIYNQRKMINIYSLGKKWSDTSESWCGYQE